MTTTIVRRSTTDDLTCDLKAFHVGGRVGQTPLSVLPLMGFVLLIPFGPIEVPGIGTTLAIPLATCVIALSAVNVIIYRLPLIVGSPVLAAAGAAVLLGALSSITSVEPILALRIQLTAVIGLALAVTVARVVQGEKRLRQFLAVLLIPGTIVCASSLASAGNLQVQLSGAVIAGRLTGVFGQPNELGFFAAVVTVLAVGASLVAGRRLAIVGAVFAALFAVLALLLSFSRSAWIGALVGSATLVLVIPRGRRRVLPVLVGIAAFVTAMGLLGVVANSGNSGILGAIQARAATIQDPTNNPYDDRPAVWLEAERQIASAPFFGHGSGNFRQLSDSGSPVGAIDPEHAHDFFLTLASEEGLIAAGLVVLAIVYSVLAVGRIVRRREPNWEISLVWCATLLTILVEGLLDFPLRNATLALLTWFVIGLFTASLLPASVRQSSHSANNKRASAATAGLGRRS